MRAVRRFFFTASSGSRTQIYYFEGDTGLTTSSGRVTQWDDQSGYGNHIVPVIGGAGPSLTSENSLTCPYFSANAPMRRATFVQGAVSRPSTFYQLYRQPLGGSASMLVRSGDGTNFVEAWPRSPWVSNQFGGGQGSGGADYFQYWMNAKSESAGSIDASIGPLVTTTRLHLACIVSNGASSSVYVDDMTSPIVTGTLASGTVNGLLVGGSNAAPPPLTNTFTGSVCALVAYTGADSAAQRNAVKTMFARWGTLG